MNKSSCDGSTYRNSFNDTITWMVESVGVPTNEPYTNCWVESILMPFNSEYKWNFTSFSDDFPLSDLQMGKIQSHFIWCQSSLNQLKSKSSAISQTKFIWISSCLPFQNYKSPTLTISLPNPFFCSTSPNGWMEQTIIGILREMVETCHHNM